MKFIRKMVLIPIDQYDRLMKINSQEEKTSELNTKQIGGAIEEQKKEEKPKEEHNEPESKQIIGKVLASGPPPGLPVKRKKVLPNTNKKHWIKLDYNV